MSHLRPLGPVPNTLTGEGAAHPDVIERVADVIADAQPTAINGRSTDAARALANADLLAKPVDWDMIERAARLLVTRVGRTEVTRSDIGLARDMFAAAGLLAKQGDTAENPPTDLTARILAAATEAAWADGLMHCDGPEAIAGRAVAAALRELDAAVGDWVMGRSDIPPIAIEIADEIDANTKDR